MHLRDLMALPVGLMLFFSFLFQPVYAEPRMVHFAVTGGSHVADELKIAVECLAVGTDDVRNSCAAPGMRPAECNFSAPATAKISFAASGSVGIGTTAPVTKTDIEGSPGTAPLLVVEQSDNPAGSATAPTTLGSSFYLGLGNNEYNTNSYRLIGFGYNVNLASEYPAFIGYQEISSASDTYGDLVFGTRSVTTNTTPTERMRITNSGNVGIGFSNPDRGSV